MKRYEENQQKSSSVWGTAQKRGELHGNRTWYGQCGQEIEPEHQRLNRRIELEALYGLSNAQTQITRSGTTLTKRSHSASRNRDRPVDLFELQTVPLRVAAN